MDRVYRGQSVAVASTVASIVAAFCSLQNRPNLGEMGFLDPVHQSDAANLAEAPIILSAR